MKVQILKEELDKNTYLELKRTFRVGSVVDLTVKAFLTNDKSEIGHAFVSVDGKRNAELLDIFVKQPFRNRGIGSKMLTLLIDYLQDGMASEIQGEITRADNLPKVIDFYKKQGFSLDEYKAFEAKHTVVNLTFTKPKFSEFYNLHEVSTVIPKNKRLGL